jgi:hypothetical protein
MNIKLNVPFNDKDRAKALGARWSPAHKTWCIPSGVGADLFDRWMPKGDVVSIDVDDAAAQTNLPKPDRPWVAASRATSEADVRASTGSFG